MDKTFTTPFDARDAALRPVRRRAQERPNPGEPLWVEKPEFKQVQEMESGRHLPVAAVMGTDYEAAVQQSLRQSRRD